MAPLFRLEHEDAAYHVTTCGNGRQAIYYDDTDRHCFLRPLGAWSGATAMTLSYGLIDNQDRPLLETRRLGRENRARSKIGKAKQCPQSQWVEYFILGGPFWTNRLFPYDLFNPHVFVVGVELVGLMAGSPTVPSAPSLFNRYRLSPFQDLPLCAKIGLRLSYSS